ncbi:metal-dependent hydrolase, beta-lactamase superfamily I [Methylophilaceae bacterium 11]|jgi:phosphoribosyl 1,2-cyclic phosphodiesterase|nr:metal-dependent hydrolase, beta-lactamase superfamily I [Methylophilaceae bacterium 11]
MRFASLGSGSAGNATMIEVERTRLLLDCGFSVREMLARLARLELTPEQLSGILVTHEHDDHARGAFKLAAKYRIPVWLSYGTYKMCERYLPSDISDLQIQLIDSHTDFTVDAICVSPFPVPHDAREPTQFTFSDGRAKLGILTDVGSTTAHIERVLSGCDALMLECNHDLAMLAKGPYAKPLKDRVGGRLGHLDNQSAATLLSQLDNTKLKHIVAAHLSEKNNTPILAQTALSAVLGCAPDWVAIAEQTLGLHWRSL